jgi:hypothetical protein
METLKEENEINRRVRVCACAMSSSSSSEQAAATATPPTPPTPSPTPTPPPPRTKPKGSSSSGGGRHHQYARKAHRMTWTQERMLGLLVQAAVTTPRILGEHTHGHTHDAYQPLVDALAQRKEFAGVGADVLTTAAVRNKLVLLVAALTSDTRDNVPTGGWGACEDEMRDIAWLLKVRTDSAIAEYQQARWKAAKQDLLGEWATFLARSGEKARFDAAHAAIQGAQMRFARSGAPEWPDIALISGGVPVIRELPTTLPAIASSAPTVLALPATVPPVATVSAPSPPPPLPVAAASLPRPVPSTPLVAAATAGEDREEKEEEGTPSQKRVKAEEQPREDMLAQLLRAINGAVAAESQAASSCFPVCTACAAGQQLCRYTRQELGAEGVPFAGDCPACSHPRKLHP